MAVIAESVMVAQVEEPMASTDAGDSTLHNSTEKPSIVKSAPVIVTPEAATVTVAEVSITTLALRESAADLDPVLPGIISEMASVPSDIVRTIIEIGFGSASAELAPAMDIMKKLALQIV